ncbi:MAG: response regulator [Planctomycetota bacterium]
MIKTQIDNAKQLEQRPDTTSVLIVDNDPELARLMLKILARKGIHGTIANDKRTALDFLNKDDYDLVFTIDKISPQADVPGHPQGGFELLSKIRVNSPELSVVMMAEAENQSTENQQRTIETAVKAIRQGCYDFLIKPVSQERIEALLDTLLPNHSVVSQKNSSDFGTGLNKRRKRNRQGTNLFSYPSQKQKGPGAVHPS